MGMIGYFSALEIDCICTLSYWFFLLLYCIDVFTEINYFLTFILTITCFYFFLNFSYKYSTSFKIIWEDDYVYFSIFIKQYCFIFLYNLIWSSLVGLDFFCFDDVLQIYWESVWLSNSAIMFESLWFFSSNNLICYRIFLKKILYILFLIFVCCYNIFWLPPIFFKITCLHRLVKNQTENLIKFLKKTNKWVFVKRERFFFIKDLFWFIKVLVWLLLWFDHLILILKKIGFLDWYVYLCYYVSQYFYKIYYRNSIFSNTLLFILMSTLSNIYFFKIFYYSTYLNFFLLNWFGGSCQFEKPFSGFYYIFFKKLNHIFVYFEFKNYFLSPTLIYHRAWWKVRWWKKSFFKKDGNWLIRDKREWSYWSYIRPYRPFNIQNSVLFKKYVHDFNNQYGWINTSKDIRLTYLGVSVQNIKIYSYTGGLYWGFADKNISGFIKDYNHYFNKSEKKNFQWWSAAIDMYVYPSPGICDYTLSFDKTFTHTFQIY